MSRNESVRKIVNKHITYWTRKSISVDDGYVWSVKNRQSLVVNWIQSATAVEPFSCIYATCYIQP